MKEIGWETFVFRVISAGWAVFFIDSLRYTAGAPMVTLAWVMAILCLVGTGAHAGGK